jgi:hypothetical protein
MKRQRRRFLQLAGAAAVAPAMTRFAVADDYPNRTSVGVRIVQGTAPV